eukprot:GFUD01002999.1.p1 GENE.GFUD01002999.1~~GFUD01002999.1.p1  ORF type:complete len:486 (-),score=142.62 GFUD01002999.1:2-1459(-)
MSTLCFLCGSTSSSVCPHCSQVAACSSSHLSVHRPNQTCRPFIVKRNPVVGRYLVAARDILPLETVLCEEPLCVGPSRERQSVCVECLQPVQDVETGTRCAGCRLPLCSTQCADRERHAVECQEFRRRGWTAGDDPDRIGALMEALTTIRMVLKKKSMRKLQEEEFIEDLFDLSQGNGDIADIDEKVLSEVWDIFGNDLEPAEFRACYNQLFINGKSLGEGISPGSALYLVFSIMNHSCVANTSVVITKDAEIQVKAQQLIKQGQEITTRYGGLNLGQPRRSQLLFDHWKFSCSCPRCQDPTELATYNSGLGCTVPGCQSYLLPYRALVWHCQGCGATQPVDFVLKVIRDAESFIKNNVSGDVDSEVLERTVWSLQSFLHPHHYLLAQIKLVLLNKYSFHTTMSRPVQERVLQLGQELAELTIQLDSVYSATLGKILKILIPVWSRVADADLSTGSIDRQQFLNRKRICYRYVDNLILCSRIKKK